MLRTAFAVAVAAALLGGVSRAQAGVVVTVDKTAQRLTVTVNGAHRYEWPVSTARMGYRTPNGSYRPERLERQWYSRRYDWSPMPHSIFFSGGYAIHGSYEISRLGRPASHGCIRLHPQNAATLYALVKERVNDTRIVVTGGEGPSVAAVHVPSRVTAREFETRTPRYRSAPRDVYESRRPARYVDEYRPPVRYMVEGRRSRGSFEEIFEDEPRRR